MGLSSTTAKTTSNETATTTPNNPQWVTDGVQGLAGNINAYGNSNPLNYVAPLSQNQNDAIQQAQSGGGQWKPAMAQAQNLVSQATGTQPNLAGATYAGTNTAAMPNTPTAQTYNPATGQAQQASTTLFGGVQMSPAQQAAAAQAQAYGYNVPTLAGPTMAQGSSFGGAQLGNAAQATAQGYTAQQAEAARIADIERMQATQAQSASLLDGGLDRYLNPATEAVVNTTMAGMDDANGRARAAQAAQAATAGAFGGSRLGIREAQTEADMSRVRAATEAGLRGDAFDRATGLAVSDADRRQNTSLFNANATNAANSQNANAFNARGIAQGQLDQGRNLFNTGAVNDASAFGANANNTNSMFNTGQSNSQDQARAAMQNSAGIASMQSQNQLSMFNAGAQNEFSQFGAGLQAQAARDLAAAQNQSSQFNAGQTTQNNQFNAGQSNQLAQYQAGLLQQAGLSNQGALNAGAQFNAGQSNQMQAQNLAAQNAAAQFGANATNSLNSQAFGMAGDMSQYNAGALNQGNQFNAGVANQNSMFNAGQQDNAIQRQLQAAGLLGNMAQTQGQLSTQDINNLLATGQISYEQAQAYAQAPVQQLANQSQMYGNLPLNLFSGQTINSQGTGTSKQSNGLLGQLIGAAAQVGSAVAGKSERRVKRDIVLLGREPDNLGVYAFNYNWDPADEPTRYGVMVDEVEVLRPWALGPIVDGIKTVNYSALEAA